MFGRSNKAPAGLIKYFGLTDWWLTAFTEEERKKIVSTFQPLGGPLDSLTVGDITYSTGTAVGLLSPLAGWFRNEEDRSIAFRIIEKAEELASQADVLDRHFHRVLRSPGMNRNTREYRWLIPAIIVLAGVLISWWQSRGSELSWWHIIGLGLSVVFLALVWLWPNIRQPKAPPP